MLPAFSRAFDRVFDFRDPLQQALLVALLAAALVLAGLVVWATWDVRGIVLGGRSPAACATLTAKYPGFRSVVATREARDPAGAPAACATADVMLRAPMATLRALTNP